MAKKKTAKKAAKKPAKKAVKNTTPGAIKGITIDGKQATYEITHNSRTLKGSFTLGDREKVFPFGDSANTYLLVHGILDKKLIRFAIGKHKPEGGFDAVESAEYNV
jgi:hypothetical protein